MNLKKQRILISGFGIGEYFLIKAILYAAAAVGTVVGAGFIVYYCAFKNYELFEAFTTEGVSMILKEIQTTNAQAIPVESMTEILKTFDLLNMDPEYQHRFLIGMCDSLERYLELNSALTDVEIVRIRQNINLLSMIAEDKELIVKKMEAFIKKGSLPSNKKSWID